MAVVTVFVDQSARLYQDVVDALRQLDPPPELAAAQQAYLEAWQGQLDLMRAGPRRRIPESGTDPEGARATRLPRCGEGDEDVRCEDLQAAVDASGSDVDLACGGRPS